MLVAKNILPETARILQCRYLRPRLGHVGAVTCGEMNDLAYVQPPETLAGILTRTSELGFELASEDRTGALLRTLAASKPGGRFLELGTGTGVATAWLLEGIDDRSTLISVDNDGTVQAVARDSLGADNRLTLVTTGGLDFLRDERPESFDLVFGDAM